MEIHLAVAEAPEKSVVGQVTVGKTAVAAALVSVLVADRPVATKATDKGGEFKFDEMPAGPVTVEVIIPGKRIVASLNF